MRKFARFIFDTWYGAFLVWCASGLVTLFICYTVGPYRSMDWLGAVMIALHALSGLMVPAAVIYSLSKKRWLRALVQLLLGVLAAFLFVTRLILIAIAVMFSEQNLRHFENSEQPWYGTEICEQLPFAVEYQAAHPFLAEYHKRIAFKSGKRIAINVDTGGAGAFAVYVLEDGRYYLVDGLDAAWIRSEYRVDPKQESVELKCGSSWLRIPDGALAIEYWSNMELSVKTVNGNEIVDSGPPVSDSLEGKRFVGIVTPRGQFKPGGEEPEIEQDASFPRNR